MRKYLSTTTIYQDAKERLSEIEKLKQQIEKRATKYPPGKIHIIKTRGNVQFYLRNDPTDKSGKYIPKKEEKKIRQYLQKKYDEESLQLISQEISVLEKFLLKSKVTSTTIQNLYSSQPQEINSSVDKEPAKFIAVYFDIDHDLLISRIVNRRSCPVCGEIYNLKYHPTKVEGICDKCGAGLTQRKDDNVETAEKRFETYFNETAPLIEYYKNKGLLKTLDANGSINEAC